MGKITGKDGIINFDDDQVAQVRSWSVDETGDTTEDTVIGDNWRTFKPTINGFSGSLELYYDTEDLPQGIVVGAEFSYELMPEGDTVGNATYIGAGIVTSKGKSGSFDGMTEQTIAFQGTGELVEGVVPTSGSEPTLAPPIGE